MRCKRKKLSYNAFDLSFIFLFLITTIFLSLRNLYPSQYFCLSSLVIRQVPALKSFLNKIISNNSSNKIETNPSHFQTQKIYLFESNQKELEDIISFPMTKGVAPGYVYFVQEYMNGTFKIGKTKHVERRMNLFGVKLPFENKLIYLILTANYHQTEVAFHKHFSDKRLEGEWFALNQRRYLLG